MILRRWNLRALRPDPRRIHGDPWPSTPFSHFRGNVRGKRRGRVREREKKGRIISPSHIHPIDDLSFISIKNLRAEIRFDDHDALLDRSSKGKKERKKKHRFRKIRTRWRTRKNEGTARSTGFHLSVVFLFSCSSFRNTGRPIFTFRLNFVFSKSKFGASPGPR